MKKIIIPVVFALIGGFAPLFAQSDFQPGQAKVTAAVLNVRNIASSGGEVVGSLKRGDVIDVIDRSKSMSTVDDISDYWYKATFTDGKDTKTGWVFGGYVSFELNMESGLRWKNLSPSKGQKLSAIAASESGDIYAGTEQGNVFVSSDRGKTWNKIVPQALGVSIGRINRILFSGKAVFVASKGGNRGGVWKSANGGSSWAQFTSSQGLLSNEVNDIIAAPDKSIYAATDKGISMSSDQGMTWSALNDDGLKGTPLSLAVTAEGVIVAGTTEGLFMVQNVKGLLGGAKTEWVRLGKKAPNMGPVVGTVAISGAGDMFAGTSKGLTRSVVSKSEAWAGVGGQTVVNDIVLEQSGRIIVATDNGLNISLDNGASWATYKKENGLASNRITKICVRKKDKVIWVISADEGVSFHE